MEQAIQRGWGEIRSKAVMFFLPALLQPASLFLQLVLQEKKVIQHTLNGEGRRAGRNQHVCTCFKFLYLLKYSGSLSHSSSLWNSTEISYILGNARFPAALDKHVSSRAQKGWAQE